MKPVFFIAIWNLLCFVLIMFHPGSSLAWNNKDTHPAINDWAIRIFERDLRPADQGLNETRLDGADCYGVAWDPEDGTANTTQSVAVTRKKKLKQWIIDGGFSADEPEILQGLRHFHDPKHPGPPWLTDTHGVADWLESYVTPERGIPEIDAITWAIDTDDRGDDGAYGVQDWVSISQDYSWYDAKKYFKLALADDNRDNLNYGKTWRAVGEVMHLMADMAVPAHVRNDGHMWSEPLEGATDRGRVNACADLSPAGSLNYETGVETLMRALATWTNENFLSQDTVPLPSGSNTANGKPAYASPLPTAATGTYDYRVVSGQSLKLARLGRAGLIGRLWYGNNGSQIYQVDDTAVLKDQQKILIPTAVRACAAVLKRFLPRFTISAEVNQSPDFANTSLYSIHGEVTQSFSGTDWNERLIIKNGVYLVVNGKAEAIPARIAGGDFNQFTHDFSAQEGDEVFLRYDLGGYIVESNKLEIPTTNLAGDRFSTSWEYHYKPGFDDGYPDGILNFTVAGSVSVDFAHDPLVEIKASNQTGNWYTVKISNMKPSESCKINISLAPSVSPSTATTQWDYGKSVYTLSNPRLDCCKQPSSIFPCAGENSLNVELSGFNLSWNIPVDLKTKSYKAYIYVTYDVHYENYLKYNNSPDFSLDESRDYRTDYFALSVEIDQNLSE